MQVRGGETYVNKISGFVGGWRMAPKHFFFLNAHWEL